MTEVWIRATVNGSFAHVLEQIVARYADLFGFVDSLADSDRNVWHFPEKACFVGLAQHLGTLLGLENVEILLQEIDFPSLSNL